MSDPECREWQAEVSVIALDVEQLAVLLRKSSDAHTYSLPKFITEGGRWETTPAKMKGLIETTLKIQGQPLYRAVYEEDVASCWAEVVIVMEVYSAQAAMGEWFSAADLANVSLADSRYCGLVEGELAALESGPVSALRPPWARPGWWATAVEWMTAELTKAGWTVAGSIELVKSWSLSYVMRLQAYQSHPAEKEWFYFKTSADLPLFVNEAVVTQKLAGLFPGQIPRPVAIEPEKNWLLLRDFGPLVGYESPLADRLEILQQFAQMQKKSTGHIQELIVMGCCDRRMAWIVAEIEPLLNHPEVEKAVTAEEAAELRSMVAPLKALCRKLFEYGIPNGLIHGDLHAGNVARNDAFSDQLVIFDWTDSAISHPFFDMLLIYTLKDTAEQEEMRDLYLTCWMEYEPMERLLEIWRLAEVMAAVYHCISYLYIYVGVEEWGRVELYWALPYWFRKILSYGEFIHAHK